jgi:hypothetical protein
METFAMVDGFNKNNGEYQGMQLARVAVCPFSVDISAATSSSAGAQAARL